MTSPARPWFRLTTPDPALSEFGSVKEWLHLVTQRMNTVFIKSNVYNILPLCYGDIGGFGTGAMSLEEDFQDVIRSMSFPVGSYMIANNHRNQVDVFFREFRMTVRQLLQKYGRRDPRTGKPDWSNFSSQVKSYYDSNMLEAWIDVCQVIMPNEFHNPNMLGARFKKYISCHYERGSMGGSSNYLRGNDEERFLLESGYDHFPILVPRWEVSGEDVYGTSCPGFDAIGDIKQLQHGEKRGMQAIDKMVNPPLSGPTHLRNQKTSLLPGDVTYVDIREGQKGLTPIHEVNPRIQELEMKQSQIRSRIERAFYADLFLMLANSTRRQITAREIEERHEEKLLALGPVLEQLNQDLLNPLIDNAFNIMLRQGLIPDPPEEIAGLDLKVEYISIMAQAQKAIGVGSMERFSGFVGNMGAVYPEVYDKVDADQMVDEYGDALGISPRIIRSDEKVAEIRAAKAEAQRSQQKAEMIAQGASAAKDLSQANLEGDSALTRLLDTAKAGQIVPA